MSQSILSRLYLKDLYFQRWMIGGTLVTGLIAIFAAPQSPVSFYVSGVALVCILILHNIFVVMSGVQSERKDKIQLFVLSLPVSTIGWGVAKHLANFTAFIVPWLILLVTTLIMIDVTSVGDGFIPFTINIFTYVLAYYCVLLGVVLLSDSQALSTCVIIAGNIGLNFTIPYMLSRPSMKEYVKSESFAWSPELTWILIVQLAIAVIAVALTFRCLLRQKDFT